MLSKKCRGNLREIVVVVPPPLENLGDPLPNHKSTNIRMGKVRDALAGFAKKNEARFVDLFAQMGGDKFEGKITTNPLTNDGLHFTDSGYQKLASIFLMDWVIQWKILNFQILFPKPKKKYH